MGRAGDTLGYFLGQVEFVHDNIEFIIIGIVGLSLVPVALELARGWRSTRRRQAQG